MRRVISIVLIMSVFVSCQTDKTLISNPKFSKITIDTLLNEKISCRALSIDNNKVWYAANNGNYGYISLDSPEKFRGNIAKENLKPEFRCIAQTSKYIYILSVANPGLLYQITKNGAQVKLVYQENHEKVFYDSMQFFDDKDGIAIGDPTSDCPSIIKTTDGGQTWQKTDCAGLPKFTDGEAFFAASNTNLILKDDALWMVSGGKKSRVFYSLDRGTTWEKYDTPIVQGQEMTGIFTADFYDATTGFIAGGNYEKPDQNSQNKAVTKDGGKTWELTAENQAFGYTSCVQYLPNGGGKAIVSIGATGLFYSRDGGKKWKKLSSDKDFLTIRFIDNKTAVAAGKNRIVKITFK